jgi:tetratricopeptide (TPR) repeat protein
MRRLTIALLLAATVLAVFAPALRNGFVDYDDDRYVLRNPHVQHGFDAESLRWAWTTGDFYWHPVTWMSHMLDWRLYGPVPAGHHATNVALHAANAALLFVLLDATTGAVWRSALVAAVFALHPLRVESVAWIAERKDVLSTLFWLLTTLAYVRWVRAPSRARYALVLVGLALGLMSKPMLVTLPATLLLLDYWPLGRLRSRSDLWPLVCEKLPFAPLVVASIVLTIALENHGAIASLGTFPLAARAANAIVSYASYLWKLVWPAELYVPYLRPSDGIPGWQVACAAVVLATITAGALAVRRTRPYVPVGWLWYLGTLLPVIGLVQAGDQAMADRFTYVPLIGVALAIAWLVPAGAARPAAALAVLLLLLLAARTRGQIAVWRGPEALFAHTLRFDERNWVAHVNLGYALGSQGDLDAATRHLERALELQPHSARAHAGLGNVLVSRNRIEDGVAHYREALAVMPRSEHTLTNLGFALATQGQYDEAIALYRRALAIEPCFADAHKKLGVALARTGKSAEALAHFEQAVHCDAYDPEALSDLGATLMTAGRAAEGLAWTERAIALSPGFAQAHANRIVGLYQLGRWEDASAAVAAARAAGVVPPAAIVEALAAKVPER